MADDKEQMETEDQTLRQDDKDMTPPHGDELRSEETFGRTDRYTTVDDSVADRMEKSSRSQPDTSARTPERRSVVEGERDRALRRQPEPDDVDSRAP